jgi:hypothetical protein
MQRGVSTAQPASHNEGVQVSEVIRVQVAQEDLIHFREVGTQPEQVRHRTGPEVEEEDVAVAQLDHEGRGLLRSRQRGREPGPQRRDAHLVRSERLRIGEVRREALFSLSLLATSHEVGAE